MKDLIFNWRMIVLAILLNACLICVAYEPSECTNWTFAFYASKVAGIAFGYAAYRLFTYWDKKNQLPDIFKEA